MQVVSQAEAEQRFGVAPGGRWGRFGSRPRVCFDSFFSTFVVDKNNRVGFPWGEQRVWVTTYPEGVSYVTRAACKNFVTCGDKITLVQGLKMKVGSIEGCVGYKVKDLGLDADVTAYFADGSGMTPDFSDVEELACECQPMDSKDVAPQCALDPLTHSSWKLCQNGSEIYVLTQHDEFRIAFHAYPGNAFLVLNGVVAAVSTIRRSMVLFSIQTKEKLAEYLWGHEVVSPAWKLTQSSVRLFFVSDGEYKVQDVSRFFF